MLCINIEVPLLTNVLTLVVVEYIKFNISIAGISKFLKGNSIVPSSNSIYDEGST
jgi:hypothetical protein